MSKLKGHYIVCGYGRVGAAVASTLRESSTPLIVLDKDAEALSEAEEQGLLCLQGDATKDADLLAARVTEAAGLLATAGEDSENVYISLTARGLNPDLRIVARASYPEAEEKLCRAGATGSSLRPPSGGGRWRSLLSSSLDSRLFFNGGPGGRTAFRFGRAAGQQIGRRTTRQDDRLNA